MFGCRMCGNCLLQETAFICPMECPKGMRNGPCGGSTPEYCYVDKSRPCIWYRIYERSYRMGRQEKLLEVLPPLDWDKVGGETWGDVVVQVRKLGTGQVVRGLLSREPEKRTSTWESVFRPVRQPEWWNGDSEYHAPKATEPVSELERQLRAGKFVVACEVAAREFFHCAARSPRRFRLPPTNCSATSPRSGRMSRRSTSPITPRPPRA